MNIAHYTLNKSASLLDALQSIDANKSGFVLCVDNGKLVGLVTDGDIRRVLLKEKNLTISVESFMTTDYEALHEDDNFEEMAKKFRSQKILFLPIVDSENRLINVITKKQFHIYLLENRSIDLHSDFSSLDDKPLEHEIYNRPWGFYKSTIYTELAQAKVITVFPLGELSLQEHKKREEHWVVIKGNGKVVLGESLLDVYPGKYIYIPKGCKHQIINTDEKENLIFSEVQLGDYFGEDDIIRYSDKYNRS